MNVRNENGEVNVSLKWLAGVVTALTIILGAAFTIDARYAHADDVQKQITNMTTQTSYAADSLRKQMLEDKIFEIQLIPEKQRSDVQRAILDRYESQSKAIDQRWSRALPSSLNANTR